MFIEESDMQQLIDELEDVEKTLKARCESVNGEAGAKGLVLARIIAGMTEEDWDRFVNDHPLDPSWISMPLDRDKSSVLVKLQKKMEDLSRASNKDFLSGLYNRRFFLRALKREMEKAEKYRMPLTLVIIDIDDFKRINDTYGHVPGDRVLKAIGHLLQSQIRAGDYAARIGGEEFALILPGTAMTPAEPLLRRILDAVRAQVMATCMKNEPIECTLSMGAATYTGTPLITVEQLITCADRELYNVKNNGKNDFRMVFVADEKPERSMVKKDEKDFLMRG